MATVTRVNSSFPSVIRKYTVTSLTANAKNSITLDFDGTYGTGNLNFVMIVLRAPGTPAAPTNDISYDPAKATYASIDLYVGNGNTVACDLYVG